MKNGVIVDCFRRGVIGGIESAARLGFDGVQIYATGGEFSYNMTAADKKKYKKALSDSGVEVSALCGDMGGHGFEIAADNPGRVEISKRIADLAAEFGTSVVTTHIGVIPSDKSEPRYAAMLDALSEIGEYAKGVGVTFAIETGPEKAATLRGFLQYSRRRGRKPRSGELRHGHSAGPRRGGGATWQVYRPHSRQGRQKPYRRRP